MTFMLSLLVLFLAGLAKANTCSDGNPDSRYLPYRLGRPGSGVPEAVRLQCDTVEVRSGDTAYIYSGQKIHFGPGATDRNIILVNGTLIVEGTASAPTLFSGSLTEYAFGLKPGTAPWGGIRVTESGTLRMKNAILHNATFAIESRSGDVTLENLYTKGCANLVKPDNVFVKLDIAGTTITQMDFSPAVPDKAPPDSALTKPEPVPEKNGSPSISKPLLWGGIGLAVLGISGTALWWAVSDHGGHGNPPNPVGQDFPDNPDFPSTGDPRSP